MEEARRERAAVMLRADSNLENRPDDDGSSSKGDMSHLVDHENDPDAENRDRVGG